MINDGSTAEKKPLVVFGKAISEGFIIPEIKLRVIQENEIFGRKKYVPKSLNKAKSSPIPCILSPVFLALMAVAAFLASIQFLTLAVMSSSKS